jgi:hypothetical protein
MHVSHINSPLPTVMMCIPKSVTWQNWLLVRLNNCPCHVQQQTATSEVYILSYSLQAVVVYCTQNYRDRKRLFSQTRCLLLNLQKHYTKLCCKEYGLLGCDNVYFDKRVSVKSLKARVRMLVESLYMKGALRDCKYEGTSVPCLPCDKSTSSFQTSNNVHIICGMQVSLS